MPLSLAYPPARDDGYWSPITSTLDWCEEASNYYATHYVAEPVNAATNLLFLYLAGKGVHNCVRHAHDGIFLLTFCGCLVVGASSLAFHTTLTYPMQLADELAMIYTTCLMFWATFAHGRPAGVRVALGVFGVALCVFITLYYHFLQDPTFHQTAYAILTAVVLGRCVYLMRRDLATQSGAEAAAVLRVMQKMIFVGVGAFLAGFAMWTVDNVWCGRLRGWRRAVGLPWGVVLEGHGWWHFLTGVGAYYYVVWGIWLRVCIDGRRGEFELVWPRTWTSVPCVVRREKRE